MTNHRASCFHRPVYRTVYSNVFSLSFLRALLIPSKLIFLCDADWPPKRFGFVRFFHESPSRRSGSSRSICSFGAFRDDLESVPAISTLSYGAGIFLLFPVFRLPTNFFPSSQFYFHCFLSSSSATASQAYPSATRSLQLFTATRPVSSFQILSSFRFLFSLPPPVCLSLFIRSPRSYHSFFLLSSPLFFLLRLFFSLADTIAFPVELQRYIFKRFRKRAKRVRVFFLRRAIRSVGDAVVFSRKFHCFRRKRALLSRNWPTVFSARHDSTEAGSTNVNEFTRHIRAAMGKTCQKLSETSKLEHSKRN